jgi:hypothetical protein
MEPNAAIELINYVDAFYNNAFNKLIIYATLLLALIGIAWPLFLQWYQRKQYKIEEEEVKKKLIDHITVEMAKQQAVLLQEIDNKIKQGEIQNQNETDKLFTEVKNKTSYLLGGINIIQANYFSNIKQFEVALSSFIAGALATIECADERHLQISLKGIDNSFMKIKEKSSTVNKQIVDQLTELINRLQNYNTNGRYDIDLKRLSGYMEGT